MEWQPIDTAPKDGTEIIIAHPVGGVCAGFCREEGRAWMCMDGHNLMVDPVTKLKRPILTSFIEPPTHWMPMPGKPTDISEADHEL